MNTNITQQHTPDGDQLVLPFDPPLEAKPDVPRNSEIDTLRAENESLRSEIRLRDARERITERIRSAGARSPELLFEAAKDLLQFAGDGSVQNAEAIVAELKRKFPEQFGSQRPGLQPIDGGAGSGSPASVLTKEALASMKPAEIARLDWDDVRQVLEN